MTFKILGKLLASAALAFAAITTASILPAAAASTPAASAGWAAVTASAIHGVSADARSQPAVTCHIFPKLIAIYRHGCTGGRVHVCRGQGRLPFAPSFVSNGCRVTVDIYTRTHDRGHKLPIARHSATGHLNQHYVWFRVT